MRLNPKAGITFLVFVALLVLCAVPGRGQAALLMEQPYGVYGTINPTGHNAIYFANVCAETPLKVRRCHPGEMGAVISRYEGVDGYDWVAIPLIPYLYAVESASQVPTKVNKEMVGRMRNRYREAHLHPLGLDQSGGSVVRNGWTGLIGAAYERRIYAFRFDTTPAQDDAFIAWLNGRPNRSHFDMLYRNCADFARQVLNVYFPHTFHRAIFPDVGVTTPKQVAYQLIRYGHKHPEVHLAVLEIPQVPGYQWRSRSTKDIAGTLTTTVYAIPLAILNPYLAGGIFVDYLVRGRFRLLPKHPRVVEAGDFAPLTGQPAPSENAADASLAVRGSASTREADPPAAAGAGSGVQERASSHE